MAQLCFERFLRNICVPALRCQAANRMLLLWSSVDGERDWQRARLKEGGEFGLAPLTEVQDSVSSGWTVVARYEDNVLPELL